MSYKTAIKESCFLSESNDGVRDENNVTVFQSSLNYIYRIIQDSSSVIQSFQRDFDPLLFRSIVTPYAHRTVVEVESNDGNLTLRKRYIFLALSAVHLEVATESRKDKEYFYKFFRILNNAIDKVLFADSEVTKYLLPDSPRVVHGETVEKGSFAEFCSQNLAHPWELFYIYELPVGILARGTLDEMYNNHPLGFLSFNYNYTDFGWEVVRGLVLKRSEWGTGCSKASWEFSKFVMNKFGLRMRSTVNVNNVRSNKNAQYFYGAPIKEEDGQNHYLYIPPNGNK